MINKDNVKKGKSWRWWSVILVILQGELIVLFKKISLWFYTASNFYVSPHPNSSKCCCFRLFVVHCLFGVHCLFVIRSSFVHCLFVRSLFVVHSLFARLFIVRRSLFIVLLLIVCRSFVHSSFVCCSLFVCRSFFCLSFVRRLSCVHRSFVRHLLACCSFVVCGSSFVRPSFDHHKCVAHRQWCVEGTRAHGKVIALNP